MNEASRLVVFTLDERRFGLPLSIVERIVHVVEITPVPQAPPVVLGVINLQGQILPVFHLRERLGLPPREMQISDQLIIARSQIRTVALLADSVVGVEEAEATAAMAPSSGFVDGVVQSLKTLLLICDIERFLTGEEQETLDAALPTGDTGDV